MSALPNKFKTKTERNWEGPNHLPLIILAVVSTMLGSSRHHPGKYAGRRRTILQPESFQGGGGLKILTCHI